MKTLINALAAENSVIGSILINGECLKDLRGRLTADCFFVEANKCIFAAACQLADEGQAIDAVTVREKIKTNGGGNMEPYLVELLSVTPTAANVAHYAEITQNESMRRRVLQAAEDAIEKVNNGEEPRLICSQLARTAEAAAEQAASGELITSGQAIQEFAKYQARLSSGEVKGSIKTGYQKLDKILGGLLPEGLYILAARPGVGKTSLAINIAENISCKNNSVLFISLEMSIRQLTAKRFSLHTGIPAGRLMTEQLTADETMKLCKASREIEKRPLIFNKLTSATVDEISLLAYQIKDLGLIIVDYLGLIRQTEGRSLYEKTTATSAALKRLARLHSTPVLCLCQLNREVEGRRQGEAPRLSDLRDSGSIEQDADACILLHNPTGRPESEDGSTPTILDAAIAKNRHGPCGTVRLSFYMRNGKVIET